MQSVGFLLRDDAKMVVLAGEVLPGEDGVRAMTHIPRAMVKEVKELG